MVRSYNQIKAGRTLGLIYLGKVLSPLNFALQSMKEKHFDCFHKSSLVTNNRDILVLIMGLFVLPLLDEDMLEENTLNVNFIIFN